MDGILLMGGGRRLFQPALLRVISGKMTEKASFPGGWPGHGKPFTKVNIHIRRYHTAFVPAVRAGEWNAQGGLKVEVLGVVCRRSRQTTPKFFSSPPRGQASGWRKAF
jgi:hypothetical protein